MKMNELRVHEEYFKQKCVHRYKSQLRKIFRKKEKKWEWNLTLLEALTRMSSNYRFFLKMNHSPFVIDEHDAEMNIF